MLVTVQSIVSTSMQPKRLISICPSIRFLASFFKQQPFPLHLKTSLLVNLPMRLLARSRAIKPFLATRAAFQLDLRPRNHAVDARSDWFTELAGLFRARLVLYIAI